MVSTRSCCLAGHPVGGPEVNPFLLVRKLGFAIENRLVVKRFDAQGLLGLAWGAAICLGASIPAGAQVIPYTSNNKSLGTLVSTGCRAGNCTVSGGARKGGNLFHRLEKFDTDPLTRVSIENGTATRIILGVVNAATYINKPVSLAGNKGSLYILSPRGIRIENGASFSNIDTLLLTTSGKLGIGEFVFDHTNTEASLVDPSGDGDSGFQLLPEVGLELLGQNLREGIAGNGGGGGYFSAEDNDGGIRIGGGVDLVVDKSLVVVAYKSPIQIDGSRVPVSMTAKGESIGSRDGIGVIGQSISVVGSYSTPVVLRAAGRIDVREPQPLSSVEAGLLASRFVNPQALQDDDLADYAGTLSDLDISNVDFIQLAGRSREFSVKIGAYGLGCFPQDCGLPVERSFNLDDGSVVTKKRLGRPAIFFEDQDNPANPENYGDYTNAGEADEAGRGVYAGMNLEDIRIVSGYDQVPGGRDLSTVSGEPPADIRIQLDIGRLGGARVKGLSLIVSEASSVSELSLGSNDLRPALPAGGSARVLFLNNQAYANGDTAMYWYPSSDGFGTNSIRFVPLKIAPSPSSLDASASALPTSLFDDVLLNVDQNVAEDFEAASVGGLSNGAPLINVSDRRGVLIDIGLATDPGVPSAATSSPESSSEIDE